MHKLMEEAIKIASDNGHEMGKVFNQEGTPTCFCKKCNAIIYLAYSKQYTQFAAGTFGSKCNGN